MKNKKSIFIVLGVIILLGLSITYLFTKQDKNTSFTLLEKQWLESNKSKVIDMSILKDIPVINYNGSGILFDFIEDFEEVTGLDINPIAYKQEEEIKTDYTFKVVTQKNEKDILIYSDNYALLTKTNVKYNKLSEISNMNIGVLAENLETVQNVMDGLNITFKPYEDITTLLSSLNNETEPVDAIIVPKLSNLNLILSDENLHISYNINEIKLDYVITLGNDEKLNQIITKYYKKWTEMNYDKSYGNHFSNNYFTFSNIAELDKAEFKSKRYVYGFVDNKPYDLQIKDNLYGINVAFLDNFSKVAEIDIQYKKYDDYNALKEAFNKQEIDLFFNNISLDGYETENIDLISNYDEEIVVLTKLNNKVTVSSLKSLVGIKIASLSDTKVSSYLNSLNLNVTNYKNIDDLISKVDEEDIIVIDLETYNYYSSSELKKYKQVYTVKLEDEYNFKVNSNINNNLFIKYFNFYLSFISNQEISNIGYSELLDVTAKSNVKLICIIGISLAVIGLIILLIIQKKKEEKKPNINISKDNKIKYIDILTSLKNRNYLNDNIDAWDESEIYPQGIVIVDLNNIAYINDNYGHAEGDKIIKEAANILIKTQIENTEIIRTNGNEFLIYMVGYDEKQIISYIRKLAKELKDLSHNFGAAIGYSIISDEIKTVDDAINEATLDMRNNKEESR